jgi:glycosyltransferase 2 family protein
MKISKKGVFKILVSISMLTLVLYSVNFTELQASLRQISLPTALVFICGYAFSQVISAFRWWIVSRGAGIQSRFKTAVSAAFVGMYINVFGLGTLGGDLARALLLTGDKNERQISLATVIADRTFGLAVLALIGVSASFFFYSQKLSSSLILVAFGVIVCVALAWVLGPKVAQRFFGDSRVGVLINRMSQGFPRSKSVLLSMFIVASIFHIFQIALFGFLAEGIGVHIPFSFLLVTIPFANIISTLPLSWMGLGIRENVYVFFFVPQFFTHEQAVVCGALWLMAMTATSAIGGILAVAGGGLKLVKARQG